MQKASRETTSGDRRPPLSGLAPAIHGKVVIEVTCSLRLVRCGSLATVATIRAAPDRAAEIQGGREASMRRLHLVKVCRLRDGSVIPWQSSEAFPTRRDRGRREGREQCGRWRLIRV